MSPARGPRYALLLLALTACDGGAPPADARDTGEDGPVRDLLVAPTAVPTVLRATFRTDTPAAFTITARFGEDELSVTEAEPQTDHFVRLAGLPAGTEVQVEVAPVGTIAPVAEASAVTGALPAWVPDLTLTAADPVSAAGGYTVAPVVLPNGGGVVVVDARGRVVWAWPATDTPEPTTPTRAWRSLDGESILFDVQARDDSTDGWIRRVSLDGLQSTDIRVPAGHTDFVEYTPGGYLMLGWDVRTVDGRRIIGDDVREVAPDGTVRVIWSAWDLFDFDPTGTWGSLFPLDPDAADWSHANGVTYDPATDDVLVTVAFNDSIVRVDRTTGEVAWWLSDFAGGDFRNVEGVERIARPHSIQALPDGLLAFSRGNPMAETVQCSAAVELALDTAAGTSTERWRYASPDCLIIPFLGGAERLSNGNTLVAWTTAGRLEEITPEGRTAWQVGTDLGSAFGFATRIATFGP